MVPRGGGPRQSRASGPSGEASGGFGAALVEAAAAIGHPLEPRAVEAFATHDRLLRRWGARMNLTGLRSEADRVKRHFLEPIAAADLIGDEGTLVDVGSGNGFPAIPLKVLHPGLRLVMVEASEKKSAFLWAVARELGLAGTRVETRRVAGRAGLRDLLPCRYLTLRAVKARGILKGEGPLLEPGGRALFFVSAADAEGIARNPIPGLRLALTRTLPGGPGSVVAVLEAE
jgi:16S rRNA (guanine527-N7)-methyltransferase